MGLEFIAKKINKYTIIFLTAFYKKGFPEKEASCS